MCECSTMFPSCPMGYLFSLCGLWLLLLLKASKPSLCRCRIKARPHRCASNFPTCATQVFNGGGVETAHFTTSKPFCSHSRQCVPTVQAESCSLAIGGRWSYYGLSWSLCVVKFLSSLGITCCLLLEMSGLLGLGRFPHWQSLV